MEIFILLDDDKQLDSCYADSISSADQEFINRGWMIGDVVTLSDYQNELQLNAFESL